MVSRPQPARTEFGGVHSSGVNKRLAVQVDVFAIAGEFWFTVAGLTEGLTASDIRGRYDMSERDYDSTRKRMRRALLRRGLA